jgi:hypothetical protein
MERYKQKATNMKNKMILGQIKIAAFTSLGVLAFASLALADDTTSGHSGLETMEQPQVGQMLQINPGFTYIGEADFHNDSLGDISVWRVDVPVRYTIKTEPGDLRLGAFYEYSEYDTSDLSGTEKFNTLSFDVLWKSMLNDNWGYFLYGAVGCSAAKDTGLGTGLTGIGGGGVQYVWSENLSLGLGAAVATHMEDDPSVLPIIALNWQINDRWNLRTLNGATITYDVSGDKSFLVDLSARFQQREYRTDSDTSLRDRMVTVELGATYNFSRHFGLRGFAGVAAGRSIQRRFKGDKAGDKDVDPAPIVGVRAFMTF